MHANEVIDMINNGHITMPPDLKRANKKTYNEVNNLILIKEIQFN